MKRHTLWQRYGTDEDKAEIERLDQTIEALRRNRVRLVNRAMDRRPTTVGTDEDKRSHGREERS